MSASEDNATRDRDIAALGAILDYASKEAARYGLYDVARLAGAAALASAGKARAKKENVDR